MRRCTKEHVEFGPGIAYCPGRQRLFVDLPTVVSRLPGLVGEETLPFIAAYLVATIVGDAMKLLHPEVAAACGGVYVKTCSHPWRECDDVGRKPCLCNGGCADEGKS